MPSPAPDPTRIRRILAEAYPDARCALDHGSPFQLLVATVLSAQCTDARVNLTTPALFARFPDPPALARAPLEELEALIRPTGFFRNKARNLLAMAGALMDQHGGAVPATLEALAALPGVGQKTANVVLSNAFGIPALPVDTHIFRVARRLGLARANSPEKVEAELCARFPRSAWIDLHHQIIHHGRRVCAAQRPACGGCVLARFCPTGRGDQPDPHTGEPVRPAVDGPAPAAPAPGGAGPQRIVSLVPSVTELLARWGLATRLAGRTSFCVEPRWIRTTVPAVGGTKTPDLARIQALRPDLVILERDENTQEAAEALEAAGLALLVLEIRSVKACLTALDQLGRALGVPGPAAEAAAAIRARLRPRPRKGPRALALVWQEPWIAAGPDTYCGDLLRQAGLTPVGPDGYPVLSDPDLDALAPDLILLPSEPYKFGPRHQAALQRRFPAARVLRIEGRAFTWYLSRTAEALAQVRAQVQ